MLMRKRKKVGVYRRGLQFEIGLIIIQKVILLKEDLKEVRKVVRCPSERRTNTKALGQECALPAAGTAGRSV